MGELKVTHAFRNTSNVKIIITEYPSGQQKNLISHGQNITFSSASVEKISLVVTGAAGLIDKYFVKNMVNLLLTLTGTVRPYVKDKTFSLEIFNPLPMGLTIDIPKEIAFPDNVTVGDEE